MENNENKKDMIEVKVTGESSSREVAEYIVRVLDSKKARDIKLLYVEKQTVIADYFVICTGNSSTQIKSLADEVEFRLSECGITPNHTEGQRGDNWVLLDYGFVIVHVFGNDSRNFYKLEKLYDQTVEKDISTLVTED